MFNPLNYPLALSDPHYMTESSIWVGHLPFAWALLEMSRPAVLVELGTYKGDSYCGFCQGVTQLALGTKCFAIDTWKGDSQTGMYGQQVLDHLRAHHDSRYGGFSQLIQATFDEAAPRFEEGSIDLLHIDGLHTYEAVRHDYETWRPKLSRRGVIVFHDTAARNEGWGVWKLWEELRASHPHFEFENDSGLGVLGVGDQLPPPLRAFFELSGDERKLAKRYFEVLAGRMRFARLLTFNRLAAERAAQSAAQWRAQTSRPPHPPADAGDYVSLMARLVRDTKELVEENLSLRARSRDATSP